MSDLVQKLVIRIRADGTIEVTKVADALDKVGKSAAKAGQDGSEGFQKMVGAARQVFTELGAVLGLTVSVQSAVSAMFAGINRADTLKDLSASITAVSKSAGEAASALAFFGEASKRTRTTGDDLARFYQSMLPLAKEAKFTSDNFQKMIVNVAQFATAIGKPIASIMQEFEQLLRGGGRLQNSDIMAALGLGKKDLEQGRVTLQGVILGMQQLTARAGEMGQSFQSTKEKIKDALLDAFANGFNRARGDAEKGMNGILDAVQDPKLLQAINDLGEAVGSMFGPLASAATKIATALGPVFAMISYLAPRSGTSLNWKEEVDKALALVAANTPREKTPEGFVDTLGAAAGAETIDKLTASVKGLKNTIISPEIEAFNKQLGALVMTGTDVDRNMRVLEAAIKIVDARLGQGAGARAFNDQLQALEIQAQRVGKVLRQDLLPILQAKPGALGDLLSKSFNVSPDLTVGGFAGGVGITAQEIAAEREFLRQNALDMKDLFDDIFRDVAKTFAEEFKKNFKDPLSDMFVDLATTGGKNFGAIAANVFGQNLKAIGDKFASDVGETLSNAVFGQIAQTDQGFTFGGQTFGTEDEAKVAKAGKQAQLGQTIGLSIGAIANATNPKTSDIDAAAAGVSAGIAIAAATSWSVVGIVVGAVVAAASYVAKLFSPSPGKQHPYATGIGTDRFGNFVGTPNENIDANTWKSISAEGKAVWNQFYDGYMNLALKLPLEGLPKIDKAFSAIYGRFENGADLGMAASEKFNQELETYLKSGLPHQIADRFSTYIQKGFVALGFSAERFGEIWKQVADLDPAKQLQLLNDLADAAISFKKSMDFFRTPVMGQGAFGEGGLFAQVNIKDTQTFAQSLAEGDAEIVKLAGSLSSLSVEGQIAGFQKISQLMDERYQKELAYIQKINQTMSAIVTSIEAQISEIRVAGMVGADGKPDIKAQMDYYFAQLQVEGEAVKAATSPEMVQYHTQQAQGLIGKILQIGGAQSPEMLKLYQDWAIGQLKKLEDASVQKLQDLGKDLEDANKKLIDSINDFITAFQNATTALTGTPGTGTPGTPGGPSPYDPTPIVQAVGAGNGTLVEIRDILAGGQNIRIKLEDHDVHVDVRLSGDGGDGGDGGLGSRVISGRA